MAFSSPQQIPPPLSYRVRVVVPNRTYSHNMLPAVTRQRARRAASLFYASPTADGNRDVQMAVWI